MAEKKTDKKIPFEKALGRLEEIVTELESGDLELEKSLARFEEGINMAKACKEQLTEAEQRIEKLLKGGDGKLSTEPLETEGDTGQNDLF